MSQEHGDNKVKPREGMLHETDPLGQLATGVWGCDADVLLLLIKRILTIPMPVPKLLTVVTVQ